MVFGGRAAGTAFTEVLRGVVAVFVLDVGGIGTAVGSEGVGWAAAIGMLRRGLLVAAVLLEAGDAGSAVDCLRRLALAVDVGAVLPGAVVLGGAAVGAGGASL